MSHLTQSHSSVTTLLESTTDRQSKQPAVNHHELTDSQVAKLLTSLHSTSMNDSYTCSWNSSRNITGSIPLSHIVDVSSKSCTTERTTSTFWKTVLDYPLVGRRNIAYNAISKHYRCHACNLMFKQRGALGSHILGVHRQERPHFCEIGNCIARYKYRGDLNRHIATIHHGIKPYLCRVCGILFARKSVRDRHIRTKHA